MSDADLEDREAAGGDNVEIFIGSYRAMELIVVSKMRG
jgi:hypothetical protein